MAQVKVYGERTHLGEQRSALSDAIHRAAQEALGLPENKRFHRFFPLDAADFVFPPERSGRYTILEIHLFAGRRPETLRCFLRALQGEIIRACGLHPDDLEIVLLEAPPSHWGLRGRLGDELQLNYEVNK
ncbi:tautomerase family protein [Deinococcus hopiensis]|uniref:Tautomerase enzyme n=1 Tax=Deinococcus hopiensis KR-140 TaxID=695939 RepID=A0A1W1VKH0_9DEIO|nr:tautomerase family protein [Deinococcus hopiensis]SMB93571.1 Tautomerase enzyme [Deinococcus hopiensis KR-140]